MFGCAAGVEEAVSLFTFVSFAFGEVRGESSEHVLSFSAGIWCAWCMAPLSRHLEIWLVYAPKGKGGGGCGRLVCGTAVVVGGGQER